VPLAFTDATLDMCPECLWIERPLGSVSSRIATQARGSDVGRGCATAGTQRLQMLCRALKRRFPPFGSLPSAENPHVESAIEAFAALSFEGGVT
jgi:hypothetical protein